MNKKGMSDLLSIYCDPVWLSWARKNVTTESTRKWLGVVRTQPDIMEAGPDPSRDLRAFPGKGTAIKAGATSRRREFPKGPVSP
jgi:hypothetical protein